MPRNFFGGTLFGPMTLKGFNEAAADAAEFQLWLTSLEVRYRSFNEAAADAAEFPSGSLAMSPCSSASMRPRQMPRNFSGVSCGP